MLYFLGIWLSKWWGPFRLLSSHLVLMGIGTVLGGLLVWRLMPRYWSRLPHDRGKQLAPGGHVSKGKPTGAGLHMALFLFPLLLLVVPFDVRVLGVLACLMLSMLFGYLDDASRAPWGEWLKGSLDLVVALLTAALLYHAGQTTLWLPFVKGLVVPSFWVYVPCAALLIWLTMNATNCSDGVDGLAGSLTLLSLFALGVLLYGVVGYRPIANYLLIPHNPNGARWAVMVFTVAGGLAGYLWHNAEPSRVLMGDAGSRFLGLLVGVSVLASGNPMLVFVVSPVVLLNGGTGLFKLLLLRLLKRVGFDITPPVRRKNSEGRDVVVEDRHVLVMALHSIRFPLHDHCRKNLGWSNAQVLMRFVLIQAVLTPFLFIILMKIR
jgi:phospho-N-acetylmuramoyl-pentapeptide-transferase